MKEKTLFVLAALGINYDSLKPFQQELLERNAIRFVIDSMIADGGDRTKYLQVLWKIPANDYHEKDKERLYRFEPRIKKVFEMSKFSSGKFPALSIVQEIEKYYHAIDGKLPPLYIEVFKSTWDGNFQGFDKLLFSNNRIFEDLSFIFLMSGKFNDDFANKLTKTKLIYPGLVGRALIIEKEKKEELDKDDIVAFCLAQTYHNKARPIVKYYTSLSAILTKEQSHLAIGKMKKPSSLVAEHYNA